MFSFNDEMGEVVKLDQETELLECMLAFIYTGQTAIESSKLVHFLGLSHEYMIFTLKQSLEAVLASNITAQNFKDTIEVAKMFEC